VSGSTKKPKANYYLLLPNGTVEQVYIKNLDAAKAVIMSMEETVKLIKIKR